MSPGDNEAPALELSAHESIRCASIVVYKQTELKLALWPCPLLMAHFPPGVERPAACLVSEALPVALAISGKKKKFAVGSAICFLLKLYVLSAANIIIFAVFCDLFYLITAA